MQKGPWKDLDLILLVQPFWSLRSMDRLKGGGIVVENWIAFVEILLKGQPGFVALNKTLKA